MTKKFFCFVLTLILALSFVPFAVSAAGNTFGTEIVLDTVGEIKSGDSFTVTVYVKDIQCDDGLLSVDLPLQYDSDKLEYVSKSEIYPEIWNGKGDNFCGDEPDEPGLYWQRLIYDGFDDGYTDKGVKDDRVLGVSVTFRARGGAQGDALIEIKSNTDEQIGGAGLEGSEIIALDGGASQLKVSIVYDSSVPAESVDTSVPEESEGDVTGEVSEEADASETDASRDGDSEDVSEQSGTPIESIPEDSSGLPADADGGFGPLAKVIGIIAACGVAVAIIVFAWGRLSAAKASKKAGLVKDDDDDLSDDVDLK